MSPNQRTILFMNLREHLKAAKLQFFERPQERQLLLMMRTESMTFVQVVTVRPDGAVIRVETKLPLVVPVHRRLAAAELVARLNRVTERGHYDLDIDTGDIVFRIDAHPLGNALFPGLLVKLLSMALQPAVRDWPVLEGVLLRDEDSREAIRGNAERIARLHEEQQRAEGTKGRPKTRRRPGKPAPSSESAPGSDAAPPTPEAPPSPPRREIDRNARGLGPDGEFVIREPESSRIPKLPRRKPLTEEEQRRRLHRVPPEPYRAPRLLPADGRGRGHDRHDHRRLRPLRQGRRPVRRRQGAPALSGLRSRQAAGRLPPTGGWLQRMR